MSASDKKKLRKEQKNEMLTARQRQEQTEARKLKAYTITFIAIMSVVILVAVGSLIITGVRNSGIIDKNTIAASVNGDKINSVVFNYYYQDKIHETTQTASEYYGNVDQYYEIIGLDPTKPLNEQTRSNSNETWADFFVNAALEEAKFDYTFAQKAANEGFTLPATEQANLDNEIRNLELNAKLYQYPDTDTFLKTVYDNMGSDLESYKAYLTRQALANAYWQAHYDNMTIDQSEIDNHAKDKATDYNTYDYSYVYLSYSYFLKDSEDSEGDTTPTDEDKNAARAEAKKMADELFALGNLDDIRDKVNTIENTNVKVQDFTNTLHTGLNNSLLADWLSADERTAGEIGLLEYASKAEEGKESEINGYYVICFTKKNDNTNKMSNVRHLLVEFEGGTEDEVSGEMVYSTAEKEAAEKKAKELLEQWQAGEATEDSFIALVKEHTDDVASAETGGLYEDIHAASKYVENFLAWSIDPERKEGDTGIVETEYGYHIMYFKGYSDQSYRDLMITDELKSEKHQTWHDETLAASNATLGKLNRIPLDHVLEPTE